jgi:hypothetical protein
MEIIYMEDDEDAAPRAQRPRVPPQATRAQSYRPPVSQGSGHSAWFICTNDNCIKAGFVATGKNTPTLVETKRRCGTCRGLGILTDGGDGGQCEVCHGSGRRIVKSEMIVLPVRCPYCRVPMEFLQEGGMPVGYHRMDIPTPSDSSGLPEDGNSTAGVSFGRNMRVE